MDLLQLSDENHNLGSDVELSRVRQQNAFPTEVVCFVQEHISGDKAAAQFTLPPPPVLAKTSFTASSCPLGPSRALFL